MILLRRLDELDRQRFNLYVYETRWRRVFFLPKSQEKALARIEARWERLTRERDRVLSLIYADPNLRSALKQREEARLRPRSAQDTAEPDLTLGEFADTVVAARVRERAAKSAYQDAVNYYKWGDYKNDRVDVHRLGHVIDHLKATFLNQQHLRASRQLAFETEVRAQSPGETQSIIQRDELLNEANMRRLTSTSTSDRDVDDLQQAFETWIRRERGDLADQREQEARHMRQRARDR